MFRPGPRGSSKSRPPEVNVLTSEVYISISEVDFSTARITVRPPRSESLPWKVDFSSSPGVRAEKSTWDV
eukprot:7592048-Alexandrium_andersonii.AAC.1